MGRTNLSVDSEVFEQFAHQARSQNKTLFALANESLASICKICNEGGNVSDLYPLWHVVSILKQIDVITLPSDFIEELIEKQYEVDKEGALRMFWNLGAGLVGILKIAAEDVEALAMTAKDFALLLPIKTFKVDNSKDGFVEVSIVGAGKKPETAECSAEFIKAVLNGYGYETTRQELGVGTIRVWARRRGKF